MAVTEINPKTLVQNTFYDMTAGTPTDNNIVATSTTDGWQINGAVPGDRMLFRFVTDAGGTQTVVFNKGAYPPAARKFLGDLTKSSMGNSKEWFVSVEVSRFLTASGTIIVVPADAGMTCTAVICPRGG